mgnify:CR=1 FL=1|jgi:hypothetical protein
MRSASPSYAGIGRTSTCDAASVAKTPSAKLFARDWNAFASPCFGGADGRRHRQSRGDQPPLATGDGHA